jgi:hypothetical protein
MMAETRQFLTEMVLPPQSADLFSPYPATSSAGSVGSSASWEVLSRKGRRWSKVRPVCGVN